MGDGLALGRRTVPEFSSGSLRPQTTSKKAMKYLQWNKSPLTPSLSSLWFCFVFIWETSSRSVALESRYSDCSTALNSLLGFKLAGLKCLVTIAMQSLDPGQTLNPHLLSYFKTEEHKLICNNQYFCQFAVSNNIARERGAVRWLLALLGCGCGNRAIEFLLLLLPIALNNIYNTFKTPFRH